MNTDGCAPILIAGRWRPATSNEFFHAENPVTREASRTRYPISEWPDIDAALTAAAAAFRALHDMPAARLADFLRNYASRLDSATDAICTTAAAETGYPVSPRLRDVEMARTIGQLQQAAAATENISWRLPQIDANAHLCSILEPLGPVVVFGPNNFPLAFNAVSGGDFVAAIASGNPVIAKGHPSHPETCRLLAECAQQAAGEANLPAGTVQLLYALRPEDGLRLAADPRVGAAAFTGSRAAGMRLKAAADAAGKPIFLEMSSVNPVVILPGALEERSHQIANELASSALLGAGQFCTNPGLVFLVGGPATDRFLEDVTEKYRDAPAGHLLDRRTQESLVAGISGLVRAGAEVLYGNKPVEVQGYAWANTLLRVSGRQFSLAPGDLMTEVFGNATLVVVAEDLQQLCQLVTYCEGSLTGCVYSAGNGDEDAAYDEIARVLRPRVGRLLNDKMPTGVAVSPAMVHGGPYPATGHPHFTSVGLPAAMRRFTRLACYDNVRPHRLPAPLSEWIHRG